MDRFVRGLSGFATSCRRDLTGFHIQEESLNAGFKVLRETVRQSLLESSKPKAFDPTHSGVRTQSKGRRPQGPIVPQLQTRPVSHIQPLPFPIRGYALQAHPCMAASRLYRPRVREVQEEDRLELIDEYIKYPSVEGALLLDGKIDPALKVGNFDPNELKWNGSVPVTVV
jgi:hypothetical protein